MAKYILRLISALIIMFLTVPFVMSLGCRNNYSLLSDREAITVRLPNGEKRTVNAEELFIGFAAALMPEETDTEALRALCVVLNTPSLTENGISYLTGDERAALFGESCDERCEFYASVWNSARGECLELTEEHYLSLHEYAKMLTRYEGDYADRLAMLFPKGRIVAK